MYSGRPAMCMIKIIQCNKEFDLEQLKADTVYSKEESFFGVCSKHLMSAEDEYEHLQSLIKDGHVKESK
jgi:hypothetical protein